MRLWFDFEKLKQLNIFFSSRQARTQEDFNSSNEKTEYPQQQLPVTTTTLLQLHSSPTKRFQNQNKNETKKNKKRNFPEKKCHKEVIVEMPSEHYCLKWNNFQNNIVAALGNLKLYEDFVDVTLSCEGKSIKAHKVILSACSEYFRDVFRVRNKIDLNLLCAQDYRML